MHDRCGDAGECVSVCDDGLAPCDGGCCSSTQLSLNRGADCAVKRDGSVWCWGNALASVPEAIDFGGPATAVSVGLRICVQRSDGIFCRALIPVKQSNQLSLGQLASWRPEASAKYRLLPANDVEDTCALAADGTIDCTEGATEEGPSSPGPWITASLGDAFVCGTKAGGSVFCFGVDGLSNGVRGGVLGGAPSVSPEAPAPIEGFGAAVMAVSAGSSTFACALTEFGGVQCWGQNQEYELGIGSTVPKGSAAPMAVESLSSHVVHISSGGAKTCAVLDDRTVWCWGAFTICPHQHDPFPVPAFGKVSSVEEDGERVCAVLLGGGVACFDWNDNQVAPCLGTIQTYRVPGL